MPNFCNEITDTNQSVSHETVIVTRSLAKIDVIEKSPRFFIKRLETPAPVCGLLWCAPGHMLRSRTTPMFANQISLCYYDGETASYITRNQSCLWFPPRVSTLLHAAPSLFFVSILDVGHCCRFWMVDSFILLVDRCETAILIRYSISPLACFFIVRSPFRQ